MPTPPATAPAMPRALLRRMVRRHRGRMAASTYLLSQWQVCESLVPVAIGLAIDDAVVSGQLDHLLWWAIGFCALFTVLSLSFRFGSRVGFTAVQREAHLLRSEVVRRVVDPRGSAHPRLPGETLSLATSDADTAASLLRWVAFAVAGLGSLVVAAVFLLRVDLGLGLLVLVGVPAVLGTVRLLAPRLSRDSEQQQDKVAAASGVAADLVAGLRVLKGVGGQRRAVERYAEVNAHAVDAGVRAARSGGLLEGATTALSSLFLAVVAVVAGRAALGGDITLGEFVAVVGLAQFLAEPIGMLGGVTAAAATSTGSARRLVAALQEPYASRGGDARAEGSTVLTVDGLLSAGPGEMVGVVLDDPAAADGVLATLRGERTGRARLAGTDLAALDLDALRRHVLVAPHRVDLFDGTLRSNVVTAAEPADWDALLVASALDDVVTLDPAGLERTVTAGGTTLSGGQRQRVALARAVAAASPVLVLHDPTTAVDAVTEHAIASRLRAALPAGAVTVVLTTSPALLAVADRVVHVGAGAEVRTGTHTELLADDDYRRAVLR